MVDEALKRELREGFYADRPAAWLEKIVFSTEPARPDVQGALDDLARGKRDLVYPGHDRVVYRVLRRLVREHGLRRGADIGSATGAFPAMQLTAGIERVTLFEQRELVADHPQVEARVRDLSQGGDLEREFDLVTCLSTVEHVGLGRYGDPLDPWGDVKLAQALRRIVRPGGFVVMSFPEGEGCVHYNLHRIYSPGRRARLLEGYEHVAVHDDRTLPRRLLYELRRLRHGRVGWFRQPIRVLRVP